MSNQEYIENYKALLARTEQDIDDPRGKNIAVLIKVVNKKKYYLNYCFFAKKFDMHPDRSKKERIEIMPLRVFRERLMNEINAAEQ